MQQDKDIEISDKMAAFCDHYVRNGGKVGMASIAAGYSDRTVGSHLLRDPRIINRIQRLTLDEIGAAAPGALAMVKKLVRSSRSDYVRLEAAKDILNRAGFIPPTRIDHRVAADLTVSFDVSPEQSGLVISGESQQTSHEEGGV